MIPASRATAKTSPLATFRSRIIASVAGAIRTRPLAVADRTGDVLRRDVHHPAAPVLVEMRQFGHRPGPGFNSF